MRPVSGEINVELVHKMPIRLPVVKFSLLVLLKVLRLLFGNICVCIYIMSKYMTKAPTALCGNKPAKLH